MASKDKAASMQHPELFISQGEKLTALLDVVVHESKFATNPDALIDYLELTGILTELLEEAQFFATLTAQELRSRDTLVRKHLDKIQTVQDAVGDWDARTKVSMPASRKRARSMDLEEATMFALKRRRESEGEYDLASNGLADVPVPNILPSIEESPTPTPWWTEPFCD